MESGMKLPPGRQERLLVARSIYLGTSEDNLVLIEEIFIYVVDKFN